MFLRGRNARIATGKYRDTLFEFLRDCIILSRGFYVPVQADKNGSYAYQVCWLSSKESAKVEYPKCQASISPFVMFSLHLGHFYSHHFHHKNEVSSHMSCSISWPCLRLNSFSP